MTGKIDSIGRPYEIQEGKAEYVFLWQSDHLLSVTAKLDGTGNSDGFIAPDVLPSSCFDRTTKYHPVPATDPRMETILRYCLKERKVGVITVPRTILPGAPA